MTGNPGLNVESVQRRLVAIRERLGELRQLETVTADRLAKDWLTRAAVERVLSQLVELAAQINTHIANLFDHLPGRHSVPGELGSPAPDRGRP